MLQACIAPCTALRLRVVEWLVGVIQVRAGLADIVATRAVLLVTLVVVRAVAVELATGLEVVAP